MKTIKGDVEARELLSRVGEKPELSKHVKASMEEFVLTKLYNSDEISCAKARVAKWHSQKKKKAFAPSLPTKILYIIILCVLII